MSTFEGQGIQVPGISALETLTTYFLIPTALFLGISVIAYAFTAPKRVKASAITNIE